MKPRPTATPEMIESAAIVIGKSCAQYGDVSESADDIADYIVDAYRNYYDGYELAKEMERKGCLISVSMIEILDSMSHEIDELVKVAEKEWVKSENIQPTLIIGSHIKEGQITGIYEYSPARYLVKETGCKVESRHLIIKFEDAVLSDKVKG